MPEYDLVAGPDGSYLLNMKLSALNDIKDRAVDQSIETIRGRVDTLGVSEPLIEKHGLGQYQILVQLPGVDDPARVKDMIQSTARLEIRQALKGGAPFTSEAEAIKSFGGMLPPNAVILKFQPIGAAPSEDLEGNKFYIVSRSSVVAGQDIRKAEAQSSQNTGGRVVTFNLTNAAGRRFADFTNAHQEGSGDPDHFLAIVLDNKVREVASIKSEIRDSGEIEGNFTEQSAKDLATLLNSGALPASIHYLQEMTVGPSLGADSIKQGVRAAIIGMLAVMIFMLIYYRAAGINADLALFLNLVILLGFMGYFGATLTLPGIAGVILTVGMGVDSNVLIFERIREELRSGKTPAAAVDQGFSKAFVTIIDTHVTTIVSAFILMIFGTGPVQGFAVTLTFGLLANLFTAVFVSRVIFDFALQRKGRGEALSI
jgi:preprotein translocase subunit SecD